MINAFAVTFGECWAGSRDLLTAMPKTPIARTCRPEESSYSTRTDVEARHSLPARTASFNDSVKSGAVPRVNVGVVCRGSRQGVITRGIAAAPVRAPRG